MINWDDVNIKETLSWNVTSIHAMLDRNGFNLDTIPFNPDANEPNTYNILRLAYAIVEENNLGKELCEGDNVLWVMAKIKRDAVMTRYSIV